MSSSKPSSSKPGSSKPSKAARRDEAREKARRMREEAERRSRRTRVLVVALSAVVVLALVVGIGFVIQRSRAPEADPTAVPANVVDDGIVTGDASAPVTVEVYLDYQCPICQQFEATNAEYLDGVRADGTVKVVYKPISILDRMSSGTRYSTRAAAAAGCVAEADPDAFAAWNDAMFVQQPVEGGRGLTDSEMADIATTAGVPDAVSSCIDDGTYTGWATTVTENASADGYSSTPTVLVSGPGTPDPQPLQDRSQAALQAAVETAAGSVTG